MQALKVPLSKPSLTTEGISVWEWSGSAFDEGDEAATWFSNYLGKPYRLVRFNEGIAEYAHPFFCYLGHHKVEKSYKL